MPHPDPADDIPASGVPRPRSNARLLIHPNFGPWFFGNLVSTSGDWLFNVTAAIVVYRLSGSAFLVGMVSVAQFVSIAALAPLVGPLTDRVDRRLLLLAGQSVAAASAAGLAGFSIVVGVENFASATPLILAAIGIGLGKAVTAPALQSLVPALVDDVDLEGAIALNSLTFSIGRALGPATAGAVLVTLGAEIAFVVNACSFFSFILALLVIRARPQGKAVQGSRSIRAGLRFIRDDRAILLLLGGVAAVGFTADPVITLGPALVAGVGGSDAWVAALVSGFGVCSAAAALLSGRIQRAMGSASVAALGMAIVAVGCATVALSTFAPGLLLGFAAAGSGFTMALTSFTAALHRRLPDALRGRIMALWSVAFLGMRPVAALLNGAVADVAGPRWATAMAVVVAVLGASWALRLQDTATMPRGAPT